MKPFSVVSFRSTASPNRIVGVMPRGYDIHDERVEVWQPLTIDPARLQTTRSSHFLYLRRSAASARHARARATRTSNPCSRSGRR